MRITFARGKVDFIPTETHMRNASLMQVPFLYLLSTCETNGCLDPPYIFLFVFNFV